MDVNQAISDLAKMLRRLLREDVKLELHLSTELPAVVADVSRIEQVVMNLVVNARDAMPEGGRLIIETTVGQVTAGKMAHELNLRPGRYVRISVIDSGQGMSSEVVEQIFDPFFTTKPPGEGTGLGLSTVHGIVEQAGGRVVVRTELGRGTMFRVYLPTADTAAAASAPGSAVADAGNGGETLLVCEDDDMIRDLVVHQLQQAGYSVLSGANGSETVRVASEHAGRIDLFLTDVILPDTNGRRLAREILANRPEMRTLFMTGYAAEVIDQRDVDEDDVAVLSKPFTGRDLLAAVREVLDRAGRPEHA
jgi:CheY-like chemotaxis protein